MSTRLRRVPNDERMYTEHESCAASRDWVVEETGVPPKRRKPKGHKHDKLRLLRLADIEQKLKDMPAKVAEYRVRFPHCDAGISQPPLWEVRQVVFALLTGGSPRCRSLES